MDAKQIKSLMSEFDDSGLSKLKIIKNDFTIELEKSVTTVMAPVAPIAQIEPTYSPAVSKEVSQSCPSQIQGDAILSPMVGTYYSSPSPDSPTFVKKGDVVKKGQVLAILEAMKIMNELEADFDCKILDIIATNGQAVEYDMPLFIIEKI